METVNFLNLEYLYYKIYQLFTGAGLFGLIVSAYAKLIEVAEKYRDVSMFISAVLAVGIVYCWIRVKQIRDEEEAKFGSPLSETVETEQQINKRWQRVLKHLESENESDWRLAVLESDIILEEMLEKMGYRGETVGDILKNIEKSDFTNLDKAWEAHKIRNTIAHEGADFALSEREARRTVALYEDVFREFHFI